MDPIMPPLIVRRPDPNDQTKQVVNLQELGERGNHPKARYLSWMILMTHKYPNHLRHISDFQFKRNIGKGGFGQVWLANDLRTGKVVAVKELFGDAAEGSFIISFGREIEAMCKVKSRFSVPFVGYTAEPPYAIITEYMPKGTLFYYTNRTRRKFQLSGTHLSIMALCLAHGMAAVRGAGVIHRDLKSANILLDQNRLPIICDYGIAHVFNTGAELASRVGTLSHMAPEVIEGRDYTYESDQYGFGMLLFEMSEGTNPFGRILSRDTFIDMILKEKRIPTFSAFGTPKPLRKLMVSLWNRIPAARPSWGSIFEQFASGEVYFKGTDKKVVADFADTLRGSFVPDGTFYQYNSEGDMEPLGDLRLTKNRLIRNLVSLLDTLDDDGNEIDPEQVIEVAPSTEEELDKDSADRTVDETIVILRDGANPMFMTVLDHYAEEIKPSQFSALFSAIRVHFTDVNTKEVVLNACLKAVLKMAGREPGFFLSMQKAHLFSVLPVTPGKPMDLTLEFIVLLTENRPNLVNATLRRVLASFILTRPSDAMQLFIIYASKFESLRKWEPVVDLYISYARAVLNDVAGAALVYALLFLMNQASFSDAKSREVKAIFSFFCRSKCVETSQAAIVAVTATLNEETRVPFDAIVRNLSHPILCESCLSLLARVREFPVSVTLCKALVQQAQSYPLAFDVLWRYASQQVETAGKLSRATNWMKYESTDAFTLFLVVFTWKELRDTLIRAPEFPGFITKMASHSDKLMVIGISTIMRRADVDQCCIDALTKSGFFRTYNVSVKTVDDLEATDACLTLLDRLVRVGHSRDYAAFLSTLVKVLKMRNKLSAKAIQVLASYSYNPILAARMKKPEILDFFSAIQKIPTFAKLATTFLANCEKV